MTPESWFVRELKAFDPKLFCIFDSKKRRFEIREWFVDFRSTYYEKYPELYQKRSCLVMTVAERNERFEDIGFRFPDRRILFSLKKAQRDSEDPEKTAREVDEANRALEEKGDREAGEICKDMAKEIYHFSNEPTVSLYSRQSGRKT